MEETQSSPLDLNELSDEEFVKFFNEQKMRGLSNVDVASLLKQSQSTMQIRLREVKQKGHKIQHNKISSTEDFIRKSIALHGYAYCYEKTKFNGSNEKLIITCHVHGDFRVLPNNHLHFGGARKTPAGCPNGNCQKLSNKEREAFQQGWIICRSCKEWKLATTDFFPLRSDKETFRRQCKVCLALKEYERRIQLGERYKESERQRWLTRRQTQLQYLRTKYHEKSKDPAFLEAERKRNNARAKRDKHKWTAQRAKRRAAERNATPPWLTTLHLQEMKQIYKDAGEISALTGRQHHVDHIIPLISKKVCGLHVPWNLQILEAAENIAKSNRLAFD